MAIGLADLSQKNEEISQVNAEHDIFIIGAKDDGDGRGDLLKRRTWNEAREWILGKGKEGYDIITLRCIGGEDTIARRDEDIWSVLLGRTLKLLAPGGVMFCYLPFVFRRMDNPDIKDGFYSQFPKGYEISVSKDGYAVKIEKLQSL